MSTEFFNDQWRIPSNENQNKISNYSMDFDGSSSYIDCGDSDKFSFGDGATDRPFSLSGWVKPNDLTKFRFINKWSGSLGYEYLFSTGSNDSLSFIINSLGTASRLGITTSTLTSTDWQHWVATYDGTGSTTGTNSGMKIYINGVEVTTSDLNSGTYVAMQNTTAPLKIGTEDNNNYYANGKIDQVTVFDYALSQDQVTQLGAEGYAFNFPTRSSPAAQTIFLNNQAQVFDNATNFSFSGWFKIENNENQSIFDLKDGSNRRFNINYHTTSQGLRCNFNTSGGGNYASLNNAISNGNIAFGEWFHYAGVFDGSGTNNSDRVKLYINGQPVSLFYGGTQATSLGAIGATNKIEIGQSINSTFRGFRGNTGNIQMWDASLLPSEVTTLYNNGKPLYTGTQPQASNMQFWYKLDGSQDTFNGSQWTLKDNGIVGQDALSSGMTSSNLIASDINGELVANPMITSPKPIAYYQLGDQSVSTGPTSDYLVPNNSLSNYVFNFIPNDYINLGTPFSFTQNLTVSFWIKSTQTATNTFIGKDINVSGGRNWMVMLYQNKVYFWTTSTGSLSSLKDIQSNVPGAVSDGKWHHIVCVNNQANVTKQIYIDGVLDVTSNNGGLISTSSSPVQIGKRPSGSPYDGEMSNLALWNTALTGPQVETIYNNGAPNDISSLSPVAWYKLNASEVFNSTSTEWSVDNNAHPSVYQSSLNFNGVNDYLNCGNDSSLQITGAMTISCWVKGTSTSGAAGVGTQDSSSSPGYLLGINDVGQVILLIALNSSTVKVARTTQQITTTEWHHIVGVYTPSVSMKVYIDGQLSTTETSSIPSSQYAGGNDFIMGIRTCCNFDGQISNAAIWNTDLDSTQVGTLYNNGTPEASISHSPVSWWKLDNTTTGIQDSAGSNDGTNNGATEYVGFVNALAGESVSMDSSNLVVSDLQQTSGYSPYALDFDGIDDYLGITSTNFKGSAGTVSYSFWVKPETYGNPPGAQNFGYFINNSSTGGGIAYSEGGTSFGLTPGQMYLYNMTNAGVVATTTSTFIDENAWNHIVVVFNTGNIVQFYKNGILSSTLTSITSFDSTWDTIAGRRYPGGFNNPINGCLSNFSIFDTALTATQVTEIFNEGLPSNLNNFSGTAPVSWWQIGSNSSYNSNAWTCLDEIGTNNAVSVNMPNDAITNGVGYSASGLGTSSIDIIGDAPYSTANGLSENMDVLDRTTDVPS